MTGEEEILQAKQILPLCYRRWIFESIHCKSDLSDLETDVGLCILCQLWLISGEDLDASCPHPIVEIHFGSTVGRYYLWTLTCTRASGKLSSVSISSPPWILPAIFLLDRGKGMFAEVCCSFYMCRAKTWYKCFNARMENIWMFCWVSRRILACSDLTVEKYKAWSSISAFLVSQSR